MKKEGIGTAVISSIIAGAALGTGFLLAQKFIVKSKGTSDVAEEVIMTTKPMAVASDDSMSNLVGTKLAGGSKWSNARGVASTGVSLGGVWCRNQNGTLYNGGTGCSGGTPVVSKGKSIG